MFAATTLAAAAAAVAAPPAVVGTVAAAPDGVALVTTGGAAYRVAEDDTTRLLFLDEQFRGRAVRLTVRPTSAGGPLQVVRVQTVNGGRVFDVDYWCENCQLSYPEPGACKCCHGPTVLRERPAK